MVDMSLIRPLNKGQGHSFWYQDIKSKKKSKSKKDLYSAVYSTDSEALGGRIK